MGDWKNGYWVSWRDTPENEIKYANQIACKSIVAFGQTPSKYHNKPECANKRFVFVDPHFMWFAYSTSPNAIPGITNARNLNSNTSYTSAQKNWINRRMVWKVNQSANPDTETTGTWPQISHFATGAYPDMANPTTKISVMWDFQQQAVIDEVVSRIVSAFDLYKYAGNNFLPLGCGFDVPMLSGDFHSISGTTQPRVTLNYWTGNDSGASHTGIDGTTNKQYSTYSDGVAAFYKALKTAMQAIFADAILFGEPARLYYTQSGTTRNTDDYLTGIKDRVDKTDLLFDLLLQEGATTDFIDDTNIYTIPGLTVDKTKVGCSQSSAIEEATNRTIAAKAAINGSWYNWFGRFGGAKTMPNFQSIVDVNPRLKLIKCVPNWDNDNNVALNQRTWDGSIYQSPKSYISSDVIYSRHPTTGKIFAVFNTINGIVKIGAGEIVTSVKRTDGYFIETIDGISDVTISGLNIILNNSDNLDKCYIITTTAQVTIPTAPSILTAVQNSSVTVKLTWQDNSNNEDGFKIEHSLNNNEWTQIATVQTGITTYTTGSISQTLHYFRVRAFNNAGNSLYSNTAQCDLTVVIIPTAPADPTNLTAAQNTTTSIKLTWQDMSNNEDGFHVEHSLDDISYAVIATVGINVTSYIATGLAAVLHYFRVRAYNSTGNSGYTNTAQYDLYVAVPGIPPATPTNLTGLAINSTSIRLDWKDNADNELGFKIEHSLDGITWEQIITVSANIQTYTVTGLSNVLHYFRVRAYNAEYNIDYSNNISLFPAPPEPEPIPEPTPDIKPYDPSLHLRNYFYVDSGLTYLGDLATVISGLDHLEGREVSIMADGIIQTPQVVVGGQITLSTPASIVHVGLSYISVLQTMRPEVPDAEGTSQGRKKRINQAVFKLLKTKHFKYASENKIETLKTIIFDDMFSGNKEVNFPTGIKREGHITIVNDQPTPITVLAIIPEMGVS